MERARQRLCADGWCQDVLALFLFEEGGILQDIIHQLKYGGWTSPGIALGMRLGDRLGTDRLRGNVAGIIPVPLHRTKKRERGYNQAGLIAAGLSRVTGLPVRASFLRRVRFTQSQTRLTAAERRLNVADAFEVPRELRAEVEEKTFLLVDDVLTTGATTVSAAKALVSAGARAPVACVVALAE
jgi:ComF family protein